MLNKTLEKVKSSKQFKLVIFADNITKRISENIINYSKSKALSYSSGGAKVKGIYDQIKQYKAEHTDAQVKLYPSSCLHKSYPERKPQFHHQKDKLLF